MKRIPEDYTWIKLLIAATAMTGCSGVEDGAPGLKGEPGVAAQNCTVTQLPDGALIICPDGSTAAVANGKDGADCKPKKRGHHE